MLTARTVSAFPWSSLDKLERGIERELRRARRSLERAAAPAAYARALGELLGLDLALHVRSIDGKAPSPAFIRVGLAVADGSAACVVHLEPALAALLLAKLLRRPVPIVRPNADFEAGLLGALCALLIEAARRSGSSSALVPRDGNAPKGAPTVHLAAIADGRPYVAAVSVASGWAALRADSGRDLLVRLGALELALPIVVAQNLARASELSKLTAGAAWLPGSGWSVDTALCGAGALVPGDGEYGHRISLGPGERIVLGERTVVPLTVPESMVSADDESAPSTLPDAVLEAPVVVRVELGMVSMKAREWAALQPGDVIETGRRIAEPVLLRAGGRVLARGELVNIEGELGVRVTEVLRDGEP